MAAETAAEHPDEVVWSDASPLNDLLGFDFGADEGADRSGLKALINSALVSHRRMPMLDAVFDRTARLMSTSLRQLTNENAEAALENVTSMRFSDFIEAQSPAGVIGVVHARGLDGYALVAVDGGLVHCVVDLLLGGRRAAAGARDDRALTAIELGLAGRLLSLLIEDFDEAFAPVATAGMVLDRIETMPRFAAIAQDASACAVARFKVRIDDFTGRISILAPHAALESVRDLLSRDFIGASDKADDAWRRRLGAGVSAVAVEIFAVLADRTMTIRDLAALRSGETVKFAAGADPHIELRAGAAALAKGKVGRLGETIAVRLDAGVNAGEVLRTLGDAA